MGKFKFLIKTNERPQPKSKIEFNWIERILLKITFSGLGVFIRIAEVAAIALIIGFLAFLVFLSWLLITGI